MDGNAVKAMMAELAPVIRDYIDEKFAPVVARLDAIDARQPERGEPGERGVGIERAEKRDGVLVLRLTDGTEQEVGKVDGEPGSMPDEETLRHTIEPMARGEARRVGEQAAAAFMELNVNKVRGEKGDPGESPTPEAVAEVLQESFRDMAQQIVNESVAQGLAQLPPPEKGEQGEKGEPGRDGRGIADLLRDHEGNLIATFDDGRMKQLGSVRGEDGKDGQDGKDGLNGRDGTDGKDGRDGFDLEAFDCVPLDERTIELRFTGGGQVHRYELEFPVMVDRGVFKAGEFYKRGDAVTWGGSLWIAQKETGEKPDTADSGWRLAVKKGRDGKDAK